MDTDTLLSAIRNSPGYVTHVVRTNRFDRTHYPERPWGVWSYVAKGYLGHYATREEAQRVATSAQREGK